MSSAIDNDKAVRGQSAAVAVERKRSDRSQFLVGLLQDLILYRPAKQYPRSFRQSVVYLGVIVAAVLVFYRSTVIQRVALYPDGHLHFSINQALNLSLCGGPARRSSQYDVASAIENNPALLSLPLKDVAVRLAGSVQTYCRGLDIPFLNSDNSLMLVFRGGLAFNPSLSLDQAGHLLKWIEIGCCALFCLAIVDAGGSVLFSAAIFFVALQVLAKFHHAYSTYPLAYTLLLAGIGLTAFASWRWRRTGWRGRVAISLAAGVFVLFAVNVRTSYLPVFLFFFGVCSIAAGARFPRSQSIGRLLAWTAVGVAIIVLLYVGGSRAIASVLDPDGSGRAKSYWYHTIAHPIVLGLALPETSLSRREGIRWLDEVGLELARRMIPEATYLGPLYEKGLWRYYFRLWKRSPLEVLEVYAAKARIAGQISVGDLDALPYGHRVLRTLLLPFTLIRSGILVGALYFLTAIAGLLAAVKARSRGGLLVSLVAITALMLQIEAILIMPFFVLIYHAFWLLSAAFLILCLGQAIVNSLWWRVSRR